MKQRTITGLAIFLIVATVLLTKIIIGTTIIFDAFLCLIAFACALEMSKILSAQQKRNQWYLISAFPIALFGLLYVEMALKMAFVLSAFLVLGIIVLFVLIGFLITVCSKARTEQEMRENKIRTSTASYAISKSMNNLLGFVYPGALLMFMFPLNHLAEISYIFGSAIPYVATVSIMAVVLCFVIPFVADTFSYLVGKTFGGKKLCPKISPNKTISGFIGGIVTTILLLLVIYFILESIPTLAPVFASLGLSWWSMIILGVLGALVCAGGDLFESLQKRKANLKDSGNLLPGHGGMLDRLDGFIFVVPVVAILLLILVL